MYIKGIAPAELSACESADSFLQSAMWGRFKSRFGWEARAFSIEWNQGVCPLLTLSRHIAPFLSMTYVPWGPELPADDPHLRASAAQELALALQPFLSSVFIRFDPPWFNPDGTEPLLPGGGFKRAAADIQPPDTVLVDLTPPLDEISAAMKPKCRYNIGLAQKRGVVVCEEENSGSGGSCKQDLEIFYRLLTETALRDGIAVHSIEYYRALFEEAAPAQLRLYIARHENDDLAAIVTLFRGKQATYLYGASSNIKRNLMAPYALQWKAMQDAKAFGCEVYDLFGIPPDENPGHPMAGLYRFKTGFGGSIVHRPGSWDYPYKPLLYALFRNAESLRKKLMTAGRR
jgi:lipid II:glycine glycyltransferase (peptidoglycan interpeptide bridge formation enzyme)